MIKRIASAIVMLPRMAGAIVMFSVALCTQQLLAQDAGGTHREDFYVDLGAGVSSVPDLDYDGAALDLEDVGTDTGLALRGALGYAMSNGLRTEFEYGLRQNDLDSVLAPASSTVDGDIQVSSYMVNLLYDFYEKDKIGAYVGAGVGLLNIGNEITLDGVAIDDDALTSGFQAIVGGYYSIAENLQLDLSYRYLASISDADIKVGGDELQAPYRSHGIFAGLRYYFGDGAAPVVAETAYKTCWDGSYVAEDVACPYQPVILDEEEPRETILADTVFTVYFATNSSRLTQEATSLIAQAVRDVQNLPAKSAANSYETFTVEGHTDTTGSATYNLALSQRRAEAVAAEIRKLGVPEDNVVVRYYGESRQARVTSDNNEEPLNRRAEVTISYR